MIEISISRELADAHPGFMAGCAERGHAISVFDHVPVDDRSRGTPSGETPPDSGPGDAMSTGKPLASLDIGSERSTPRALH